MSREQILDALRRAASPAAALPAGNDRWTTYLDRTEQFKEALAAAGGTFVEIGSGSTETAVQKIAVSIQARHVVSLVLPGSAQSSIGKQPRDSDGVDLAVCPGAFGVAENGAVWVPDSVVPEQALLFLTQHLVLTLDRNLIVNNMHEAYERLSFHERGFGTFIAGPSKTADIEQSLVIGAHGPRSLTVLLLAVEH